MQRHFRYGKIRPMNILLTSSGRRTYLVDYFQKALGDEGLVFAANSQRSPALLKADGSVITPLIYADEYIPFLLSYCREKSIDLVVPLFDIDLPVLAAAKEKFAAIGTKVAVSDPQTVALCNDKSAMCRKLRELNIGCPESSVSVEDTLRKVSGGSMRFPLMVKPRFGMGSIGVDEAEEEAELSLLHERCQRKIRRSYLKYEAMACPGGEVLLQEKRPGEEYGLDVINDFDGNYVTTIVKRKAAMRAGETDEATTLGEGDEGYDELMNVGRKIALGFHHLGNMDVDVIMDKTDGIPYVIDMNARFGGGYPFSHAAGVNLPKAYVLWAKGEKAGTELLTAIPHVHAYKDIAVEIYR